MKLGFCLKKNYRYYAMFQEKKEKKIHELYQYFNILSLCLNCFSHLNIKK